MDETLTKIKEIRERIVYEKCIKVPVMTPLQLPIGPVEVIRLVKWENYKLTDMADYKTACIDALFEESSAEIHVPTTMEECIRDFKDLFGNAQKMSDAFQENPSLALSLFPNLDKMAVGDHDSIALAFPSIVVAFGAEFSNRECFEMEHKYGGLQNVEIHYVEVDTKHRFRVRINFDRNYPFKNISDALAQRFMKLRESGGEPCKVLHPKLMNPRSWSFHVRIDKEEIPPPKPAPWYANASSSGNKRQKSTAK